VFCIKPDAGADHPRTPARKFPVTAAVLKGECDIAVNQDRYSLSEGSVFMIEGQDDFAIPEVKKNLSLYVTLSPNPENAVYAKGIG
jgi:quercetin dioxygenase-like cupin family protein